MNRIDAVAFRRQRVVGVVAEHLADEAAFWRSWLVGEEYAEERAARRRTLDAAFPPEFAASIGARSGEPIRVLDVGSGPMSTLPRSAPQNAIELVRADALADA